MPTIFSKIIAGEIPAQILYQDEKCTAFLDVNPMNPGHTLLVPVEEVDYLFDLPSATYEYLWGLAPKLAAAIKAATGCKRVCVAVEGFSVPHAHIHLIPLHEAGEFDTKRPKPAADPAELTAMREKIVAAL